MCAIDSPNFEPYSRKLRAGSELSKVVIDLICAGTIAEITSHHLLLPQKSSQQVQSKKQEQIYQIPTKLFQCRHKL